MEERYLKDIAQIKVGMSISRMKEKISEVGIEQKVITPRAIQHNGIKDKELEIIKIKNDMINLRKTQKDDIILKTTSPFDIVLIDEKHEGLFYNSFCLDITVFSKEMESAYVFAVLNSKRIKDKLENKVKSFRTTPISKKDMDQIKIPFLEKEKQKLIGELYLNIMKKQNTWEQLVANEKEMVEMTIFEKGGIW